MPDPTITGSGFAWSTETQVGYCSQADLEKKIGQQRLAELTNDNMTQGITLGGAGSLPDVDVVTKLIAEADSIIDSYVGMRYAVPFLVTAVPADINTASIDISCYLAFKRQIVANKITEDWQATYDSTIESLRLIASGEMEIGEDANQAQGKIVNVTDVQQTQFYNSDYNISKF